MTTVDRFRGLGGEALAGFGVVRVALTLCDRVTFILGAFRPVAYNVPRDDQAWPLIDQARVIKDVVVPAPPADVPTLVA